MKVQIKKEPKVLQEYNTVIREQLDSGVIEKVTKLEKTSKVHYIPHLTVVPKEASTSVRRFCKSGNERDFSEQ